MGSLLSVKGKIHFLLCILFGHENVGKSLQEIILNIANNIKNIQKQQNVPARTHKKRKILLNTLLDEYTSFLTPSPLFFFEGRYENSKKLCWRGDQFLKKSLGETKRGGRKENTKVVEVMGFSYFNLLTIS